MSKVEVVEEPQRARASGKLGVLVHVRLMDSKTGKQVGEAKSASLRENECRLRESRKY